MNLIFNFRFSNFSCISVWNSNDSIWTIPQIPSWFQKCSPSKNQLKIKNFWTIHFATYYGSVKILLEWFSQFDGLHYFHKGWTLTRTVFHDNRKPNKGGFSTSLTRLLVHPRIIILKAFFICMNPFNTFPR